MGVGHPLGAIDENTLYAVRPLRPPIPGIDLPNVLTLRNLDDVDRIKARVDAAAKRVVVVGAGFIGLELAENFVKRGVETVVVELQTQVLPPLDPEMTVPIVEALTPRGVRVILGDSADAFEAAGDGGSVKLKSGETLAAYLVILGVGVRPENKLAVDAGLDVGQRGGIRVSESMQTSDPSIWAVGDAVEIRDFVTGTATQVPLAGPANRQGRIAAAAILRGDSRPAARYRGTQGTSIVGVFDRVAAAKDAVNMAGFVAAGLVRGDHPQADMATALDGPPDEQTTLLDVRTPKEFAEGHLPGAVNIPVDVLRGRLGELPTGKRILAYCQVGMRGYIATRILLQKGFDVANLGGGCKTFMLLRAARGS